MLHPAGIRIFLISWLTVFLESGFFLAAVLHHCTNEEQRRSKMRITPSPPPGRNSFVTGDRVEPVSSAPGVHDNGQRRDDAGPERAGMLKAGQRSSSKPGLARWRYSAGFLSQFIAQMHKARRLPSERPGVSRVHSDYLQIAALARKTPARQSRKA